MSDLEEAKRLLEEIGASIKEHDAVLRGMARDIRLLVENAIGTSLLPNSQGNAKEGKARLVSPASRPTNEWRETGLKKLIERWSPMTMADLALLSAYHLQYIRGYRGLTGAEIQINLKRHGLHVANTSVAMNQNTKVKPPRMKKRKLRGRRVNVYVLTNSGAAYVEENLDRADARVVDWRDLSVIPQRMGKMGHQDQEGLLSREPAPPAAK